LPNVFQNSFSSTREVAPPEKLEPKPFLEESELSQTNPKQYFIHDLHNKRRLERAPMSRLVPGRRMGGTNGCDLAFPLRFVKINLDI